MSRRSVAVGILIGYLACLAVTATVGARAHLPRVAKPGMTLKQRERWVSTNLAHTRWVANAGRGKPRRAHVRATRWLEQELRDTRELRLLGLGPRAAICHIFKPCSKALAVAWCESRHSIYARNGQYLGLYQMGAYARSRYGHSWTAIGQVRSAHAYYQDAGWGPWACA